MQPDAELLSAYLDGELSSEERTAVEHWLAADASARELLDELRALRIEVQQLPRVQLPEQFAHEVLRSAERLMLLGPAELTPSAQAEIEVARTELAPPTARRHPWSSPAWFITGAAVAVLLMFAVGPWRGEEGAPVADHPRTAPIAERPAPNAQDAPTVGPAVSEHPPTLDAPALARDDVAPAMDLAADAAPTNVAVDSNDEPAPANVAQSGPRRRQHAPFGVVVSCVVDRKAISSGAFDRLLADCGIEIAPPRDGDDRHAIVQDVIYAEGSADQLAKVFEQMLGKPDTFTSPVWQMTLGVFREPELWSELLDAGDAAASGARAVHFRPQPDQAKALLFEEPTREELLEGGVVEAPSTDGTAVEPAAPEVDNGLVRAVFILHVAP